MPGYHWYISVSDHHYVSPHHSYVVIHLAVSVCNLRLAFVIWQARTIFCLVSAACSLLSLQPVWFPGVLNIINLFLIWYLGLELGKSKCEQRLVMDCFTTIVSLLGVMSQGKVNAVWQQLVFWQTKYAQPVYNMYLLYLIKGTSYLA